MSEGEDNQCIANANGASAPEEEKKDDNNIKSEKEGDDIEAAPDETKEAKSEEAKTEEPKEEITPPVEPKIEGTTAADEAMKPSDESITDVDAVTIEDTPAAEEGTIAAEGAEQGPSGAALNVATTAAELEEGQLVHKFQPGDHVIRWEMLPIVWPIQIHGIVLDCNQQCVTIADFGLTAEIRQDESQEQVEETLDENNKKGNKSLKEAWEKVKPNTKNKERITVHIITTQEEIKPWKKVHYGRGLFGLGGDDSEDGEEGAAASPKKSAVMKQKVGKWFKRVSKNMKQHRERGERLLQQKQLSPVTSETNMSSTTGSLTLQERQRLQRAQQIKFLKEKGLIKEEANLRSDGSSATTAQESSSVKEQSELAGAPERETEAAEIAVCVSETQSEHLEDDDNLRHSASEPALHKPSNHSLNTENSTHSLGSMGEKKEPVKEKNKLPESDPPKLVLARTNLLLEQGENILPPYHPFKSNSECIAVFCKTGYWRTLQASVFLHSTAIGNAKSSMAMTLGVAASAHVFAPVVALAGAALVGAPYIILNQSAKMWQAETLRLNEEFWKQAPNEVFVECIEHWSGLVEKEAAKKKEPEEEATASELKEEEQKQPPSDTFVSV